MSKEKWEMSALDAYINKVYRFIIIFVPFLCICAATTITVLYYLGLYQVASLPALFLFDLSVCIYTFAGIYLARSGFGENGIVLPEKLRMAKLINAVSLVVQWNAISYIWPFRDFWAYCILFTFVLALFFDFKLVFCTTVAILVSMFISWGVKGTYLLPNPDFYFNANMVFRFVGISLMLLCVNLITLFGGEFFVEELERFVNYDTLTHLLNRRSMDNYLKAAYKRADSGKSSFSLLIMDIDDFKKVNDTYGHDCGDEVLKSVAGIISCGVRKNDSVFRWGGEEILVILNVEEYKAVFIADRIRKEIENTVINYKDARVSVTVTIGLAPFRDGESIQDMMDKADKCLYYGKTHGKNQIVSMIESEVTPFNETIQALTDLPNASGYMHTVDQIRKQEKLSSYSAFYFDVKRFGCINADIGQENGDHLIHAYAEKLKEFMEKDEVVGHLGGDNFMALVQRERQEKMIRFLSGVPVSLKSSVDGGDFLLSATIGIWEIDDDNIETGEIISRPAMALNLAKHVKYQDVVTISDHQIARIREQKSVLLDYKEALEREEFYVYYQPKVDSRNGRLVGAEGLVRWEKNGKFILPGIFIPPLEESGEILYLDYYVLKHVCEDIKRWEKQGIVPVKVSVNFSRKDLCDESLAENINRIIEESGIDKKLIEIEVTETVNEEEQGVLEKFIHQLYDYGIMTAIDDFGAGYSSIASLREFQVKTLKIDRSFVNTDFFSWRDEVVLKAIINMAKELGMEIIIEGVEREEQLAFVNKVGCFIIQGFYYDKPMPVDDFKEKLKKGIYLAR